MVLKNSVRAFGGRSEKNCAHRCGKIIKENSKMQIFLHIFKYIMKKRGKIVQLIFFIITFVPENIENKHR